MARALSSTPKPCRPVAPLRCCHGAGAGMDLHDLSKIFSTPNGIGSGLALWQLRLETYDQIKRVNA
uniref:Uncharacterized protein n=1 Tax=Oryza brachyantha TaxID=4533 RepID=J3NDW4_ORYBR